MSWVNLSQSNIKKCKEKIRSIDLIKKFQMMRGYLNLMVNFLMNVPKMKPSRIECLPTFMNDLRERELEILYLALFNAEC